MDKYNKGVIYTNDKCIGCNKCLSSCSLLGANVSIVKDGVARMEIDSQKCNDCGRCLKACIHEARDYRDDTEAFFADLKKGEKISPTEPNGYKFELLVLDMVHMMDNNLAFEVEREKEFAPIKNLHGTDSVDSARELLKLNKVTL